MRCGTNKAVIFVAIKLFKSCIGVSIIALIKFLSGCLASPIAEHLNRLAGIS
jgi:hypothetical protein